MNTANISDPNAAVNALEPENLEKYSSAITLSDMEIFIFPELLYSLVLANIMSPIVWTWRDHSWFRKIRNKSTYRKVLRMKQFILDSFEFNLDLDTWGLTTQERELERFKPFMDEKTISVSNALFGYEGDKYYFDLDIRRHFGLDNYTTNVIPYWKTETVEAMQAFQFRDGYRTGAGECVSLSTLYAAALFVVCEIPLEDIFLMATPLHSQNFVDVEGGILTNNRRIVTKNMWFNGSELSARAQRALRNEQVTLVAHNTGYIHVVYPEATIDPEAYARFNRKVGDFLVMPTITMDVLANFLRYHSELQACFQIEHMCHGKTRYIPAEKVYAYEHSSAYRMNEDTRAKLLDEICAYEFYCSPLPDRINMNKLEQFFEQYQVDLRDRDKMAALIEMMDCPNQNFDELMEKLIDFCMIQPRLPQNKTFTDNVPPIKLEPDQSREQIIEILEGMRAVHPVVDLAFYAYRDMSRISWAPFLKAALERNPVAVDAAGSEGLSDNAVVEKLDGMENASIYDGARLAQPDEVWNFLRGDGVEKAICLADILKARHTDKELKLCIAPDRAELHLDGHTWSWASTKGLCAEFSL